MCSTCQIAYKYTWISNILIDGVDIWFHIAFNQLISHRNHENIIVLLLTVSHHQYFWTIESQVKNELQYTLSSANMNLHEFIFIIFKAENLL